MLEAWELRSIRNGFDVSCFPGRTRRQLPRALSQETSVMSVRYFVVGREGKCLELCLKSLRGVKERKNNAMKLELIVSESIDGHLPAKLVLASLNVCFLLHFFGQVLHIANQPIRIGPRHCSATKSVYHPDSCGSPPS